MRDDQEIFNKAVLGVIEQGKPSKFNSEVCAYRGPDGTKCAVGFLITDGFISPKMNHQGLRDHEHIWGAVLASNPGKEISREMLVDLQDAHDTAAYCEDFLYNFQEQAKAVAQKWNLEMPKC